MKRSVLLVVSVLFVQLAIFQAVPAQEKKLTILYSNDLHAHLEPQIVPWVDKTRPVGGFANIATLVKREKAANPNTVYFDAGDFFTGPYISSLTKGEAVIDAMNYLGLDAACVGNHEFDHGWENAIAQFKNAKFPILNGNIFIKGTESLHWNNPYIIKKVNGIRIGIIGMHGKFAFYDTTSDEMIKGVEARDEEAYLKKYIAELKSRTDIIVLLTHQGIPGRQSSTGSVDVARNLKRDIELAQNVPGIDIIVTGHAHTGTPKALVSNGTIIVSTDAYTIELGKLEITYDKKLDKITSHTNTLNYLFDDEVPDDPQVSAIIRKWNDKLRSITEEKVTNSTAPFTRSYGEESVMGNMVADAMLNASPDSRLAITNSGGLRQDIDAGPVTVGELISAFPFPNTIVQLEMKGSDLRTIFEHGAGLTNGILQVSKGVEIVYDEAKPVGSRITSCKIKGEPLADDKTYKLVTSNFLADGGDGFLTFKKTLSYKNTGVEILQSMIRYLKQFPTYEPKIEGRVKRK
ncbi:MAG: bifunctional metallophosphatase/5'-nucleotidase [Pyrinomonadaceae bacterium]|nr:bifunctional metallophosphatase/5'-nucleotidase [Pyrinomonadaceae bacterium]MBP6212848.1 bifunctional metallophosphatase/5'-nucleotidase [Pyrinomonadaceae bacterium]